MVALGVARLRRIALTLKDGALDKEALRIWCHGEQRHLGGRELIVREEGCVNGKHVDAVVVAGQESLDRPREVAIHGGPVDLELVVVRIIVVQSVLLRSTPQAIRSGWRRGWMDGSHASECE